MGKAYLKTAVPIRSLCLSNFTEDAAPSALDYTPAWDAMIHVAVYADPYVPEPPYCTYRQRVAAS